MKPLTHHAPVMLRVAKKEVHSRNFASLYFDHSLDFQPGQFVMVWIPGIDEKPYTISFHRKKQFGITLEAKGLFSKKAVTLKPGDLLGFRGPFGKGFTPMSSPDIVIVAGGCGMAPLAPLVEILDKNIFFIQGARSREFILYPDRFETQKQICTDDGSLGHKGFVTELLEQEIEDRKKQGKKPLKMVYACGPEIMMHRIFMICEDNKIPCQASLERYMRCGFGVCGACVCGEQVVCKDGPVFESKTLRTMSDFNTRALLKSGKPVDLDQYFSWRCQS